MGEGYVDEALDLGVDLRCASPNCCGKTARGTGAWVRCSWSRRCQTLLVPGPVGLLRKWQGGLHRGASRHLRRRSLRPAVPCPARHGQVGPRRLAIASAGRASLDGCWSGGGSAEQSGGAGGHSGAVRAAVGSPAARDVRTNEHRPGAPRGRRDHGQGRTSQGGNSRGHVEPGQVFGLQPGRAYGGGWWHGNGLCGWDRTRWSRSNCPGGGPAPSTWQKIPG